MRTFLDVYKRQLEELSGGVYKLDHLPYGDYTLKETEAPKGFFLDDYFPESL